LRSFCTSASRDESAEIRVAALARGRSRKRQNALAAIFSGLIPAALLQRFFPPQHWLIGFGAGLLWANAFEYFYHRYLLHLPKNFLSLGHLRHHSSVGTPLEPDHVNLGSSPFWVAVLFVINGALVVPLDFLFHLHIAAGMFLGFVVYQLVVEEFHWRIHLGGWLPYGRWCRDYHLAHHDRPDGRFNIFLPVSDFMFGSISAAFAATVLAKARRPTFGLPFATSSGITRLTLAEKSLLIWLFALAFAANIFQSATYSKNPDAGSSGQTHQTN
jgi:hypothetical protein